MRLLPFAGAEVSKNNNHLQAGNEIKHDEVEVSIEIGRSGYANAVWKSTTQFARDMKVLCKEKDFVVNVLGNCFPPLSPFLLLIYHLL